MLPSPSPVDYPYCWFQNYQTHIRERMWGRVGENKFGVWRPGGYFCWRPASIENFLGRLASVFIMAFGVSKPHFLASSVHRATFPGVLRPSFFRVQQLNELSFFVMHRNYRNFSNRMQFQTNEWSHAVRPADFLSSFRTSRQRGLTERRVNSCNLILVIHPFERSYLIGLNGRW